jgi:hypothetical protein
MKVCVESLIFNLYIIVKDKVLGMEFWKPNTYPEELILAEHANQTT